MTKASVQTLHLGTSSFWARVQFCLYLLFRQEVCFWGTVTTTMSPDEAPPGSSPATGVGRARVYAAIDTERDYQDRLPATRTDGQPRTVGDYLVMLDYYLRQAIDRWTMSPGDAQALDAVRKVAGICVHCMEDHGAPCRQST
jgi:hypothetical protein